MQFKTKASYNFEDLVEIMQVLRKECPWDKEQTHLSIRSNFLEETYEAIEAIDTNDPILLREELGDVLLQVVFHSQMEAEVGTFNINDVCDGICKKLIYRHPHIFANFHAKTSDEVLSNWDELKKKEKGHTTTADSMRSVSKSLPAMMRATKVRKKAIKAGFDFCNGQDALQKVQEELTETIEAYNGNGNLEEEIGDVFFSLINATLHLGFDPDKLLSATCDKFIDRFEYVENGIISQNSTIKDATDEQIMTLWNEKKTLEKSKTVD
ncbi:MAG: nucleoside triphosphate pyrophosphohydrolase [Epulopiscium sp. Nele67-Bin004]|nr:MAG: nucleoside triphosphate pyrophosphohydrolase [Epulopiscium sp. Nele67-Bin004]